MPAGMPSVVPPMLPAQGDLSDGDRGDWAVEFAWAGFRCVAYVRPGRVRLLSSTARTVTGSFPELAVLGERVPGSGMVLDGVVVALDDAGRPSRRPLMRRTSTVAPSDGLRERVPIGFVATDLLWFDGRPLLRRPYSERRGLLEGLGIAGAPILVPPSHPASDAAFVMETAERYGLDGLHLKRVDAPYKAGRRTRDWLRVPLRRVRPVVVGGWMPADLKRPTRPGALLLGIPEEDGTLRYVGRVGIGSTAARREIGELIRTHQARISPFVEEGPGEVPAQVAQDARWLRPDIVGAAEYQGWTRSGHLRLPVWAGVETAEEIDPEEWGGTPWEGEDAGQTGSPARARTSPSPAVPTPSPPVPSVPPAPDRGRSGSPEPGPPASAAAGAPVLPEPSAAVDAIPSALTGGGVLSRSLEQHFVYNAFNTIASLMRTDPVLARELLLGLADLSRTADRVGAPPIPLADELAAVRAYLAIEKARFGRRLEWEVTAGTGLDEVVVAPLQVLVAVRDAVQQGVEPRPEGGRVTVEVAPDPDPDRAGGATVIVTDVGHGDPVRLRLGAAAPV
jgi:bifunctional non-homologous end joining protein LigD